MRIWLIGADQKGTEALRQLKKNPNIEVIVSDATDQPKAVTERVIAKVDYVETVSPININTLARRFRPDLILIDTAAEKRNLRVLGGMAFTDAINTEIAAGSDIPCLVL
jgi:CheY-like chemotaxis protein